MPCGGESEGRLSAHDIHAVRILPFVVIRGYTDVFEPILKEYASEWELTTVKTTNMGSLFRLTYDLNLRSAGSEKEMIDKLRCRNGNLEITISRQETAISEL